MEDDNKVVSNAAPVVVAAPAPAPQSAALSASQLTALAESVAAKAELLKKLKDELKEERARLKEVTTSPNKHLIGVSPEEILKSLPAVVRVEIFFDGKSVGFVDLTPGVSKKGLIGAADRVNVVIRTADGEPPIVSQVKAVVLVPIGNDKKPKPASKAKKEAAPSEETAKKKHKE